MKKISTYEVDRISLDIRSPHGMLRQARPFRFGPFFVSKKEVAMAAIKHNVYLGGAVQSLGFQTAAGAEATIGVLSEANQYDFGTAERRESIKVVNGTILSMNGDVYAPDHPPLVFEKGAAIVFYTTGPVAYLCTYGE